MTAPYFGSDTNAEFGNGLNHVVNAGHENLGSITLGDEAASADQGLDDTSAAWNSQVGHVATTARSVLAPFAFSRAASPNGTSGRNYLPGFGSLGSGNAEDQATFNANLRLRQQGDDNAEID